LHKNGQKRQKSLSSKFFLSDNEAIIKKCKENSQNDKT